MPCPMKKDVGTLAIEQAMEFVKDDCSCLSAVGGNAVAPWSMAINCKKRCRSRGYTGMRSSEINKEKRAIPSSCTHSMPQLALFISSANVAADGLVMALIYWRGSWRKASRKGRGVTGGLS